ncbi:MAG: hypothetical protein HY042_04450 [Spirochaetia bacterium]|nr:hypothetical protein [Spirochaetia bacterium]
MKKERLKRMRRLAPWMILTAVALAISGGCLASDLNNGFDLKSPRGFMGYLGGMAQESLCRFDSKAFDSCTFGP